MTTPPRASVAETALLALMTGDVTAAVEIGERASGAMLAQDGCAVIPTEIRAGGSDADLEQAGFRLGPVCAEDALFRSATLPNGWRRRAVDAQGGLCTEILDTHQRPRVSMFYKNTVHNRDAFCTILTLDHYAWHLMTDASAVVVTDPEWASPDDLVEALRRLIDKEHEDAEFWERANAPTAAENARRHRAGIRRCTKLIAMIGGAS